jgi:trigger factor
MPDVKVENLPKNSAKLTVTVSLEELKPFLEDAARHVSEHLQIPGFRPGKADYETVKRHAGEMKIYEEAIEPVVRKTFLEAVLSQHLETVGSPAVDIVKLAPGNDLIYTATVALMPVVEQLADFRILEVKAKPVIASDEDVGRVLKDLQRWQTKEVRATTGEGATKEDKVTIDMNLKRAGVPIEGGQTLGHAVYLNESYYVPGFIDEVLGMKEGEQKTFTLTFPKEHVQKSIAGQPVEFDVRVKELYHLDHPAIDDAFATSLSQKDLADLKARLQENLTTEREEQETYRLEREILELVAGKSRVGDIPDLLVNEEINKMLEELKRGVAEQGLDFDTYLKNLKKTLADLKLDMSDQAVMRIKVALVIREIAKRENITIEKKELDGELDRQATEIQDKKTKKLLHTPAYRDYTENILRNRKVTDLLRQTMIK